MFRQAPTVEKIDNDGTPFQLLALSKVAASPVQQTHEALVAFLCLRQRLAVEYLLQPAAQQRLRFFL